ncbi:hypothetical protein PG999_012910 [Apiospora kogelbergensis]|uniref:Uncharacterized protein n=1 Tax=Apiospora kogelbergensis TaxID=1337665 RepID=A0AAW0QCC2_9PEZI
MENTYNTMPRTYPSYPSPPNLGAFPGWTGNPSSSCGPLLTTYNVPTTNTQQLSGSTFVGASPSLADRGATYAHASYTQAAIGSDTGASNDGEGEDESSASDASAPHSEDHGKKMKKLSSSSHRSHHSSEPSRHRRHRSRSAVAHRGSAHEQYRQANKAARSLQTVANWLVNDSRSRY